LLRKKNYPLKILLLFIFMVLPRFCRAADSGVVLKIAAENHYGDLGDLEVAFVVTGINHDDKDEEKRLTDLIFNRDKWAKSFTLNGKPVECENIGFASGPGKDSESLNFYFMPGGPGKKELVMTINGYTGRLDFDYEPGSNIAILNMTDNEAFFDKEGSAGISWAAYYIKNETIKCDLNGNTIDPGIDGGNAVEGLTIGAIPYDALATGSNELFINCLDYKGDTMAVKAVFYYFPDHKVKLGTNFNYFIGDMGSKRGPHYDVKTINDDLRIDNSKSLDIWTYTCGHGLLSSRPFRYYTNIATVREGKSGFIVISGYTHLHQPLKTEGNDENKGKEIDLYIYK